MGCQLLSDWIRKKLIYATDTLENNLYAMRYVGLYMQRDIKRGTRFITKAVLKLACEYYGGNKLK